MAIDRDVIEENTQLLLRRWQFVVSGTRPSDALRLGMDSAFVAALRSLEELQVRRAADCASPLYMFGQPDDVLAMVIQTQAQTGAASPVHDEVDAIVQEENLLVLTNRWSAARISVVHSQCVFGLSAALVGILQAATLIDIRQACSRGLRLAMLAAGPRYLFHAGRNPTLQRSHRTVLAACSISGLR
jgi:hypothetical protein